MSILNGNWIEVFRAGDYGTKGKYTAADIDKMICNFNPQMHEPPVVMGHPENDAPAFGWVDGLRRAGDTLLAKLKDVPAKFEELVRAGRFKKRSVSFYNTDKGPVLRHVGFLGAMPPEVKGLADVKFREGQHQAIEFNEEEDVTPEEMKKSIAEAFSEMKTFVSDLFKSKQGAGATDDVKLSEQIKAALDPMEKKFAELNTKLDQEKTARETAAASASTQQQATFAEQQLQRVKGSKVWIPAFANMGIAQIFAELAKASTKITFGEGDKKVEKPAAEVFADFMVGLGQIVPAGELARHGASQNQGNLVRFNEPNTGNTVIDQSSVALAEAAQALSVKEKITYGEALSRVRASGQYVPNGGSSSGAV